MRISGRASSWLLFLRKTGRQLLTGGFSQRSYDAGTQSGGGTYTPDPHNGQMQHAGNNGAHTLAPPTSVCSLIVEYLNGASAGAVTTSGFTSVKGAFTTTNGHKFHCIITKSQNYSALRIDPLQ